MISYALGQPTPGTPLWFYDAGQLIITSPALGLDGTVYIAGGNGLLAITNSGATASNKWTFATSDEPRASAAVGVDGTVYCAAGMLYAVNPNGSEKWHFAVGAGNGSSDFESFSKLP
jgi:outer membrane protein assembly factor BamB